MENAACTEGISRSIDELDKLINEAESLLEDYAATSSAYDSGISDRDIGEHTGNDDIRQSIDQLDAILRQYDSGTIDGLTDAEPRERQRKLADQQRHSLDGHIDVSERSERTHHKEDNGAERFEAGDRHSIADPGGLDWDAKKRERDVITSNSPSVTSPQTNAATASRNQVQVQGITQDSSSDHAGEMSGAMMAHVAPGMAHVALARRGMAPHHGDQGQYVGANGNVYRADSMSRLPPPPEDLLYDEVHCPGSGGDSIYDYPSYPPQSVGPHGEVAPPPGGQGTNQQYDSRKRPPALPKRSPSTRLSTASSVSDSPSSPNSQMTSPRFSRCSSTSDSYDNRHSQDHSHGHPDVYSNAHDQRSPGHYQRSYSVPNAHDVKGHHGQGHQGHQPLHAQTSLPQHYQQHQHPQGGQIGHSGHQGHQSHPGQHAHVHHGQPPAQHAHHVPQHAVPPDRYPSHVPQHSVPPDRHPHPHTGHPGHPHPSHPGQPAPGHQQSPGPESNGVSEKSKFFEQKMDEEAVVLRLKKGNLVDSGEPRPPSFTPPPPPSSTNNRWQGSPGQGPAPPSVTAKRSPVHQRLNQGPGRRMSEQIAQAGSPEMGRRSSETSLPPRASSFRGMPSQPMAQVTSPTSPPPVTSKPVARSNSTGTEQSRPSPIGEEVQHCVKPSMFRNAVAPPQVHDHKQQRSQSITSPIAENEPREISPAKSSDVIENEGLLKPSKIKSIIGGQGKPKQKLHHQQSAPVSSHPPAHQPQAAPQAHSHNVAHHQQHAAPQAPHIPHAPQVPPPQPPTSTFSPRQKSTPVAIPSVPKVPVIPIRTGRTPPEQQMATSPPRKNSADLVGEVSTFKLKKKKEESRKLPAGAVKPKGPGDLIHSEIVNNLKGGVKLKRRSDGPVIPEIHGDAEGENGYCYDDEVAAMVDIDDLPPPPPDFGDEYYHNQQQQQQQQQQQHDHYNQQLQQQQHDYYVQQQQQQEMYSQHNVQSSQQQQYSPNGKQQGLAMALHEQSPPPTTNGRKNSDEDLDWSHIPGYVPIPDNCPHWKIGMLEKKNRDAYEKYMRDLEERALEDARWQDVPAWKRDLMSKKEQKKKEEMAPTEDERRRMDEEMARLGNMPEWKRQIILKKRQDIM